MELGGFNVDLVKVVQFYNEIEIFWKEIDFVGVEVVDDEIFWFFEVGSQIKIEVMKGLEKGMELFNQVEVGSFLQVYYNMGEFKFMVEFLIGKYKGLVIKSVSVVLEWKIILVSVGSFFGLGVI